ncbi:hypothetical protein SCUP234_09907 [Seiridium cupressi]
MRKGWKKRKEEWDPEDNITKQFIGGMSLRSLQVLLCCHSRRAAAVNPVQAGQQHDSMWCWPPWGNAMGPTMPEPGKLSPYQRPGKPDTWSELWLARATGMAMDRSVELASHLASRLKWQMQIPLLMQFRLFTLSTSRSASSALILDWRQPAAPPDRTSSTNPLAPRFYDPSACQLIDIQSPPLAHHHFNVGQSHQVSTEFLRGPGQS